MQVNDLTLSNSERFCSVSSPYVNKSLITFNVICSQFFSFFLLFPNLHINGGKCKRHYVPEQSTKAQGTSGGLSLYGQKIGRRFC